MPTFKVTMPDGGQYKVGGVEDAATAYNMALQYAQSQVPVDPLKQLAEDTSASDARWIGMGRGFDNFQRGVRQLPWDIAEWMSGKTFDRPESHTRDPYEEAAYADLVEAHPAASTGQMIGETLPYFATAAPAAYGMRGVGPVKNILGQAGAMGATGTLYPGTLPERVGRGVVDAGLSLGGGALGQGIGKTAQVGADLVEGTIRKAPQIWQHLKNKPFEAAAEHVMNMAGIPSAPKGAVVGKATVGGPPKQAAKTVDLEGIPPRAVSLGSMGAQTRAPERTSSDIAKEALAEGVQLAAEVGAYYLQGKLQRALNQAKKGRLTPELYDDLWRELGEIEDNLADVNPELSNAVQRIRENINMLGSSDLERRDKKTEKSLEGITNYLNKASGGMIV